MIKTITDAINNATYAQTEHAIGVFLITIMATLVGGTIYWMVKRKKLGDQK